MLLNMKKNLNFQYRCIYNNVLFKPMQDDSTFSKELFRDVDDISVIKNHMQDLKNSLQEQSTSFISSLNSGDTELLRKSAKDYKSNLQKYFKMQSALITLYETQVKELKRTNYNRVFIYIICVVRHVLFIFYQALPFPRPPHILHSI